MALDEKIIKEIKRFKNINNYIVEQEVTADPMAALTPPEGGVEGAPIPSDTTATPPPSPDTREPIDVETDDTVEKIDDDGKSEETTSTEESEELDITDLVDTQKDIQGKQEEYFNNLFSQLSNLESKLAEMDVIVNKLNSLEAKLEKYREKTPQEKLELRTYDSYPFNQKLTDFFDDKQEEMKVSGKNEYVLTPDEVVDINPDNLKSSFNPNYFEDDYVTSFKKY